MGKIVRALPAFRRLFSLMAAHWIWYVVSPIVVLGGAYLYYRRYQRHRAAVQSFAAERGWSFTECEPDLVGRCYGRPFEGYGRRRRTRHAVAGRWRELEVLSFEYSEVVGHQNRARRRWTQLTGVRLPFPAPEVSAAPRDTLGRLARDLGFKRAGTGDEPFVRPGLGDLRPGDARLRDWLRRHSRPFRVVAGMAETWDGGRFDTRRVEPAVADLAELVPLLSGVHGR
ncbi:hypothetical protein AB0F91_14700 [Amycolatopsis sp. NPDC023774]|uniref:hypothetical protein n=1 Tax=Amycolatopsis sp. NPDC023774 TaxID=3155015 RepID=UPI0033CAF06F